MQIRGFRRPLRSLTCLLGAIVCSAYLPPPDTPAGAGRASGGVRGKVEFRRPSSPPEPRPSIGDLGMPPLREVSDRNRAVLYFETAPRGAFEERETTRARLDQRNEAFVPHVLAIPVGTSVDFPNSDRTYHNVFSLSRARRFDLGRYAAGRSKSVRFDRPGIVRVFCDIHSHMSAFILVFSHRFFAVSDAGGRYHIDSVPAGRYTVVAWSGGARRDARAVTIPEEGGTVELDFVIR